MALIFGALLAYKVYLIGTIQYVSFAMNDPYVSFVKTDPWNEEALCNLTMKGAVLSQYTIW